MGYLVEIAALPSFLGLATTSVEDDDAIDQVAIECAEKCPQLTRFVGTF
jgi:hypothetical protein